MQIKEMLLESASHVQKTAVENTRATIEEDLRLSKEEAVRHAVMAAALQIFKNI